MYYYIYLFSLSFFQIYIDVCLLYMYTKIRLFRWNILFTGGKIYYRFVLR
jgi:hypothetical protein